MRPRPAILLTLAYGAGLATGLLRFGTPLGAAAILAGAPVLGGTLPTVFATGAMLGRLSGEVAWLAERSACTSRIPEGLLRTRIRLIEPARPDGGSVLVQPVGAGCWGAVQASWPQRRPVMAGLEVVAEGRWIARAGPAERPGGTFAVKSFGATSGHPSPGARSAHRSRQGE